MAEYIERGALIKLVVERYKKICEQGGGGLSLDGALLWIKLAVNQTPNADVVEVVRCGECKWFRKHNCKCTASVWNEFADACPEVHERDFCSYGERRELKTEE